MLDCLKDIQHQESFNLLNNSELDVLNQNKITVHYKKNDTIVKQGTFVNNIFFSQSGLFKLHVEGNQKNIILTFKGSKVFLGISSIYHSTGMHLYSVTALEDCIVDMYDMSAFKQVLQTNVAFANEILKYVNHNSGRIFRRFINMTEKNARGKVANMILCLSNSVYFSPEYTLNITRKEMADFLGISMENIVRILKEFKNDGLVIVEGKRIQIINADSLIKVYDFG